MPTIYYEIPHPLSVRKRSGIPRCIDMISESLKLTIDRNWIFKEVLGLNKCNDFIYAAPYIQSEKVVSISPQNGDIFLSAFSNYFMSDILINKLRGYKKSGVKVNFIIHDIMPITNPDFFIGKISYSASQENFEKKIDTNIFSNISQENTQDSFEKVFSKWFVNIINVSSLIFCPSKFVINDIKNYLHENNTKFDIKFIHLPWGFDKNDLKKTNNLPLTFKNIFSESNDFTFLMVGSIETRKSHKFILDCFDKLWNQKRNFRLIWAGSDAWVDKDFFNRYKNHPLLGSKFFLLGNLSDEELRYCYEHSDALVSASLNEGFGLPNIEAATYSLPIIARDIPVFREICHDNAFYFPNTNNEEVFIASLDSWIKLYNLNMHPKSSNMPKKNWNDVANELFERFCK